MDINVRKIAELASLDISDDDIPRFERDMREIAAMVSELPDLSGESVIGMPMELRSDTLEESAVSREELMKNAPESVKGCFAVPRTVEY
ncbi:aspartyl/glutamyl-tRNA amidotransferase subunit C [Ruminococcus flavefaciens]|uniref:Asp-tRNA(Asn)/Glu-tRNA(Gln) amidotransferase subunit GatC n=1 Tax=Ruminococcus flavefaciens TaxID=1265 RepID=UPI0026EDDB2F|nr:Asp-tRNA(Asn)/Glu-tRNA(Gln) amidotransferase subunit GatC [Ruminococcus flavefaciens]